MCLQLELTFVQQLSGKSEHTACIRLVVLVPLYSASQ